MRTAMCGTRAGYQKHRQAGEEACPPCRDANSVYMKNRRQGVSNRRPSETLAVLCWCEAEVVTVASSDVVSGRTGSCGRPGCYEGGEAHPSRRRASRQRLPASFKVFRG